MKTKILISVVIIAATITGYLYYKKSTAKTNEPITTTVQSGPFIIQINSTGELQAKNSEKIRGPEGMRMAGVYRTTIASIVPEGTVVKEGDFVATLSRDELASKLKDLSTEIEKVETQLLQAELDTALELRALRDQMFNIAFLQREKRLEVEQNKYEAPAVLQRAELDLERTMRDYAQQERNYRLKQQQAAAKIQEILATLRQAKNNYAKANKLSDAFTIKAPKGGMVIYSKTWDGGKVAAGSQISAWNPTVAELPDLSDMVSKTYVNEVDISKVKVGQKVEIKVDAFPDNTYIGEVTKVANIGEQLPKFDAKVFEVLVQLHQTDSILRPAMTTSNQVITSRLDNVLYVPLECVHMDSLTYVFKKVDGKIVKQEVQTGASNDQAIVISDGLEKAEKVYLGMPEKADKLNIRRLQPAITAK